MAGGWEWIVVLIIVVLIFGVGRISKIGGELGKGVTAFRKGLREGAEEGEEKTEPDTQS